MAALNPNRERWRMALVGLILALGTLACYWPVRHFDFVNYDDTAYVTDNPHVLMGLSWANAGWAFRSSCLGNWHPLTVLSHMLDVQLFGLNAGRHHLTNLCFHTVNAVLLFLLLRSLTRRVWASAMVAALFALHPLHVESVAWVAERKDVLSTFFGLLSLWAYGKYAREKSGVEPRASRWQLLYLLSLCAFTLALMSKAMVVTLPFVMLLLDFWPLQRFQRSTLRHLVLEKLPFVFLAVVCSCVSVLLLNQVNTTRELPGVGVGDRLVRPFIAYQHYLVKMIWPTDLAVPYLRPPNWPVWEILSAMVLVGALSFAVLCQARRRPYLLVGWCWFLGTLVPVIGLVPLGAHLVADRYTYFPLIGLFIALVWLADEVTPAGRYHRAALAAVAGSVLLASAVATNSQLRYWRNSGTLFFHTIHVTRDNYVAHYCLGIFFAHEKKLDNAIVEYQLALQIAPDYAEARNDLGTALRIRGRVDEAITQYEKTLQALPNSALVHCNLGIALRQKGMLDEAVKQFLEAMRLDPTLVLPYIGLGKTYALQEKWDDALAMFLKADRLNPGLEEAHYNIGNIHIRKGNLTEAAAELKIALRLKPDDIVAQATLAQVLFQTGKAAEALPYCETLAQAQPEDAHAQYDLATALMANQRPKEAVSHFKEAVRLLPDAPQCLNALAWIYATSPQAELRNGTEAVRLAEQACQLTHRQDTAMLDTLAAAYAEAGRFDEAIKSTEEIRVLSLAAHDPEEMDAAQQRLELYRSRKPFRDEK